MAAAVESEQALLAPATPSRAELRERARARRRLQERLAARHVAKFIELHQPQLQEAPHLAELDAALDRSMNEQLLIIHEGPPRHFKTSRIIAHTARVLRYKPGANCFFATYVNDVAYRRSGDIRELAARAGCWVSEEKKSSNRFDASKKVSYWQVNGGGKFIAGGRRGQFVGEGAAFIACDDLIKDQKEALQKKARDEAWETFRMLWARLEPGGTLLLAMQRWHDDDPVGRAKKWLREDPAAPKAIIITQRAIEDLVVETDSSGRDHIISGTPLCPWRYTLDDFRKTASILGPWFFIQYQQDTRARGKKVFPELARYTEPNRHAALFISCDPGLEKAELEGRKPRKSQPDPAGIVVALAYVATTGTGKDAVQRVGLDILHAEQVWLEGEDLLNHLEGLQTTGYPGAMCLLEEVSAFRLLEQFGRTLNPGLRITACFPKGSKFWRAQSPARSAEHQIVRVPMTGLWVKPFTDQIRDFTGMDGGDDNMVDALTQLHAFAEHAFGIHITGAAAGGDSHIPKDSPW